MNTSLRAVAVVNFATALSLAVLVAPADAAETCTALMPVQVRVVEKADEGVEALRRYISITQGIHQLDMMDVATSLDGWRAAVRCAQRVAAEKGAPAPVAAAPVAVQSKP
jgi:hypothetical protein